jgi:hypothetical protein
MRKLVCLFLALTFTLSLVAPRSAQAEVPVKAKAFMTIVGYGTASGAILGLASMAFGQSSRAVAQGASLGLYAGILFGTYVLVSHHNKRYGSYDDNSSPYQQSNDIYGDEYQPEEGGDSQNAPTSGFFDRFRLLQEEANVQSFTFQSEKRKGRQMPPLHLNLIQYSF